MSRRWDTLEVDGTNMRCYLTLPDDAPAGGVLVCMHAPGVDDFILGICDRLASAGFAAIAPDLYNDFASRSDPGLNLVIRQPLPFSGGLPGKLEATGYINNLLKAGYIPIQTFDGQQIFLLPAVRSYRGALSFVF